MEKGVINKGTIWYLSNPGNAVDVSGSASFRPKHHYFLRYYA
jgi:hypothetical protein